MRALRKDDLVTSYVFTAELAEEDDGRWSAWIEALPGCATSGHSKAEALRNLQDAVEAYLRAVEKTGRQLPEEAIARVTKEPLIAVTI
jgi:predicted RNase H-like HicB family nuclease